MADHHIAEFLTDYLRLMVSGSMNAFEIENLMDNEIETHHHEAEVPAHVIAKVGDGLPAFGIVAAVMGVVHTMESVGLPPAELGILIAGVSDESGTVPRFGEAVIGVPVTVSVMRMVGQFIGLLDGQPVEKITYTMEGKLSGPGMSAQRFRSQGEFALPKGPVTVGDPSRL